MNSIVEKIRSADNLPSLPTVAVQVLRLTQADDVSVGELSRVIQQDPALTGRLLKLVNSSLFGMPRKISSLQQAMVVLGLRTVKVMVLSFSLVDTMRGTKPGTFDFSSFWRRSLTTGVASRLLAEKVHRAVCDEAFVCGLLADLGILAAYHCAKDIYIPVLERYEAGQEPLQFVEKSMLGVTHEAMSAELFSQWGLPDMLCTPIKTHHAPIEEFASDNPIDACLTRILRSAALIADLFCADLRAGELGKAKAEIAKGLKLDPGALDTVLEVLDNNIKETASLFALNIGPTRGYHEIQAEACVQLARLSMAAEIERAQSAQREQAICRKIEELAHQATTDGLTGVGNRAAFELRLEEECANAVKQRRALGVVIMDLDRFKKLNDTFGHQTGDEALRQVGACLKRVADKSKFAARYGGEEFALVVANATLEQLREIAEGIRSSIQQLRIFHNNKQISVTASLGAAAMSYDDPEFDPRKLVERADQSLYDAKHSGRNRVVIAERSEVRG